MQSPNPVESGGVPGGPPVIGGATRTHGQSPGVTVGWNIVVGNSAGAGRAPVIEWMQASAQSEKPIDGAISASNRTVSAHMEVSPIRRRYFCAR